MKTKVLVVVTAATSAALAFAIDQVVPLGVACGVLYSAVVAVSLSLGRFTPELMHWKNDLFYAKAPTRLNFDWLVQFGVQDGGVNEVKLKYVGWHEPDAVFQKVM